MAMMLAGAKAGGLPCCEILWVAAVRAGFLDGGGGAKVTCPSWLQLAPKVSSTVGLAAGAPMVRPRPFCCHFGAGGVWQSEGPPSGPGKRPECEMVVQRTSPYPVTHGTPQSGFYAPCPNADRLHCASEKQRSRSSLLKPTFPPFPSPNIFGDQKKSRTRLDEAEQNGRGAQDTTLRAEQSSHFLLDGCSQLRPSLQSCTPHPSVHPACSPGRLQTGPGKADAGMEPKPHAHSAVLTPARRPSSVRFVLYSLLPSPWSPLLLLVYPVLSLIVTQDRLRGPSFS